MMNGCERTSPDSESSTTPEMDGQIVCLVTLHGSTLLQTPDLHFLHFDVFASKLHQLR